MATPKTPPSVVPAQVGFIAIFNPSLGMTDDTMDNQIVYYASVGVVEGGRSRRRRLRSRPAESLSQEERNEHLRQIGLAQGMVEFGRSFSGERSVDTVDTEKSRVIMHELEPGWWILASIDLTRLPVAAAKQAAAGKGPSQEPSGASEDVEYSSREVKPSALLLQDLLRAHSTFLLHHDSSLSSLFVRVKRTKFIGLLGRYWDLFLASWNVMLHGNAIANVFGGIKLAASGELGVGVGEEERGSGEREVLEGFVEQIEGLVDLVVSKFGTYDPEAAKAAPSPKGPLAELAQATEKWIGSGQDPAAEDGAIFLGTGAISRKSLRDVTQWMEDIYSWGESAYGVRDSPTSVRRTRAKKKAHNHEEQAQEHVLWPPPPVTELAKRPKQPASKQSPPQKSKDAVPAAETGGPATAGPDGAYSAVSSYAEYFKLGYGKYWSIGSPAIPKGSDAPPTAATSAGETAAEPATGEAETRRVPIGSRKASEGDGSDGYFVIGLMGDVGKNSTSSDGSDSSPEAEGTNSRTMLRTLSVEIEELEGQDRPESETRRDLGSHDTELAYDPVDQDRGRQDMKRTLSSTAADAARPMAFNSQDRNKAEKVRVVIYVNRPFMFTFLFKLRTDSLEWDRLYKSLHHQLSPLRRQLLKSTAYRAAKPASAGADSIYDLVWDPQALTLQTTIPGIPDPTAVAAAAVLARELPVWSRAEAISTHTQMLNVYIATRGSQSELERTCKTNRGWWIVWSRILGRSSLESTTTKTPSETETDADSSSASEGEAAGPEKKKETSPRLVSKEIFLLRRAGDHPSGAGGLGPFRSVSGPSAAAGWTDGASRLAQGIGVDTRKYIEGLLSINH